MNDPKDVIIEDLKRTLSKLERTLRAAGSIEFQCYHNDRDRQLAGEFLKMADDAQRSLVFATEMEYGL
uniref:Uncharacterized protein n=2 Tax=unclassified bacterial viruses TaxID=12333 RepID=A0AAU6VYJ4_9VIRU